MKSIISKKSKPTVLAVVGIIILAVALIVLVQPRPRDVWFLITSTGGHSSLNRQFESLLKPWLFTYSSVLSAQKAHTETPSLIPKKFAVAETFVVAVVNSTVSQCQNPGGYYGIIWENGNQVSPGCTLTIGFFIFLSQTSGNNYQESSFTLPLIITMTEQ